MALAQTTVTAYILTEDKVDGLSYLNTANAVYLGLGGMFSGVFATLLTTLYATTLTDPTVHAAFVIGSFAFGVLFVAFSLLFGVGIYQTAQKMKKIKLSKVTGLITPVV